ncbi:hypothetical protein HK102_002777 [Quaeritorhiza haematococci]|nr:hypothetical protein HK102_002777 [Quaeritorhiza haematococci]
MTGELITYEGVPYFVAGKPGAKAGLIVIQEWWGLTQHVKNITSRFADALGVLAISPDLYRGKVGETADEANHLMSNLDWPGAVKDIKNAAKYLRSKGCEKVGITGFCMGGALTIASAVHCTEGEIDAGSCFYGIPPAAFADPKKIGIPMQFHFANDDPSPGFSDKKAADDLKATLAAAGKDVSEFNQYPNATHAFMNEDAPAYPYNEKVAKEAMAKTVAFFKKTLHI